MRAIVQRVAYARCIVEGETVGEIGQGLMILLGIHGQDTEQDGATLANKLANLRIFEDDDGKMNRSLLEADGAALIISNFTLYADTRKGRRPSFNDAAPFDAGERLYDRFCDQLRAEGVPVAAGIYGAHMRIQLENNGPVTILVDTSPQTT